jgi:hypothetical protein
MKITYIVRLYVFYFVFIITYHDIYILNLVNKNIFFLVGVDIEIKFKPNDHEEHIKESMSEDSSVEESLPTILSPRPSIVLQV